MFQLADITPQSGTDDLFWPLVWRGATTVSMFLPLSLASLGAMPKAEISAGSGFYNLSRQLGGSLGIALLTTLLDQRMVFHRSVLLAKLTPYDPTTVTQLTRLQGWFQGQGSPQNIAQHQAAATLFHLINTQAAVLSYADI